MLECPNVSLVIVGDGSERAKNEQKVKELGLKNVHFEGAIYDDELLAKYYMVSDFFVTPGVASMAIKIAMLFGIPVITADYGLEVHVVKDGINGYVYPMGEFKQISNLVKHLIKDQLTYSKISNNAIETIENDVNINKMTEAFVKEINQL
jgi:glycosyltransferase involved in cell wall biosynthesis